MVVIRLSRAGSVHKPFYHVVAADSRSPRDGRFIERLGFLNYYANGAEQPYRLDVQRVEHWVGNGAQVSPSVKKLLRRMKGESLAEKSGEKSSAEKPTAPAPAAPQDAAGSAEKKSSETTTTVASEASVSATTTAEAKPPKENEAPKPEGEAESA